MTEKSQKRRSAGAFALIGLVITGCSASPEAANQTPSPYTPQAFTNVSVIDTSDGSIEHGMTLVVSGARITALGKTESTAPPDNARIIDASGKYVIPGLWDMHIHTAQPLDGLDKNIHEFFFPLFAANGVTGVRDMNGFQERLDRARQAVASGELPGPRIVAAGLMLDGVDWGEFGSIAVSSREDGRNAVNRLVESGSDFIKVGSLTPREAYFGAAVAAAEVGLPFSGHVPFNVTASEASEAGQKSIEHMDGVLLGCSGNEPELRSQAESMIANDHAFSQTWLARVRAEAGARNSPNEKRCADLISKFAVNGTYHVPTLVLKRATAFAADRAIHDDPRKQFLPSAFVSAWGPHKGLTANYTAEDFESDKQNFERQLELVKRMHQAGVRFMAGTDTADPYIYPGFSVHDEMELFVQAGLSSLAALQTATLNPARYLGRTDSMGSVAVGMTADLVLLDANPLEDIRNTKRIWSVVLDGKVLNKDAITSILDASKEEASASTPR